jgi:hypothetical protein
LSPTTICSGAIQRHDNPLTFGSDFRLANFSASHA